MLVRLVYSILLLVVVSANLDDLVLDDRTLYVARKIALDLTEIVFNVANQLALELVEQFRHERDRGLAVFRLRAI